MQALAGREVAGPRASRGVPRDGRAWLGWRPAGVPGPGLPRLGSLGYGVAALRVAFRVGAETRVQVHEPAHGVV